MKKIGLVLVLCIIALFFVSGASLRTRTAGYETLVISAAGAETDLVAATGYTVGVPAPGGNLNPKDLMTKDYESIFNAVELTCFATSNENDTVTMSIYGIAIDGAPERIGSLVWTFGTALRSAGIRWADTCVPTSTHLTAITAADSGNNRIAKATFDVSGYRYLYAIAHTTTTGAATVITVEMRGF